MLTLAHAGVEVGASAGLSCNGYLREWEGCSMSEVAKYIENVKKYAPKADEVAVAGIVRHCGIALRNRDSSLVSASDPAELKRVVDGFCKKKLARTESDDALMEAVKAVVGKMKAENHKSRVTVYYLLAEHFGQLALFHPKAK